MSDCSLIHDFSDLSRMIFLLWIIFHNCFIILFLEAIDYNYVQIFKTGFREMKQTTSVTLFSEAM